MKLKLHFQNETKKGKNKEEKNLIFFCFEASAVSSCPSPYQSFGGVGCLQYFASAGLLNFNDSQSFCKLNVGSSVQTFSVANYQDAGVKQILN
jgi:hypothetical protein